MCVCLHMHTNVNMGVLKFPGLLCSPSSGQLTLVWTEPGRSQPSPRAAATTFHVCDGPLFPCGVCDSGTLAGGDGGIPAAWRRPTLDRTTGVRLHPPYGGEREKHDKENPDQGPDFRPLTFICARASGPQLQPTPTPHSRSGHHHDNEVTEEPQL